MNSVVVLGAVPAGVSRAMAIALPRAESPINMPPGKPRDGERDAGAAKLLAGVVGDLLVDILGAGALQMLLGILRGWGFDRLSAEDGAHLHSDAGTVRPLLLESR